MSAGEYSFIDLSVLEEVREQFAVGNPMILLSQDLERVVWANGAGAGLLGHADVETAMGAPSGLDAVTRRRIMAAPGYPEIGRDRVIHLGPGSPLAGRPGTCCASQVRLPDGETALLLVFPGTAGGASRAIEGIGSGGRYAALIDGEGGILAETEGLSALGVSHSTLSRLVREVRHEPDRLIKRMIASARGEIAAGIARLSENPPLHLLLLVAGEAATQEPVAAVAGPAPSTPPDRDRPALRFSWHTDREGRLSYLSEEFTGAFAEASTLTGRTFAEMEEELGVENGSLIHGLLQGRATWSGRIVVLPWQGGRIPVELAALPAYDRNREFDGFRGFGIVRPAELPAPREPGPAAEPVVRPEGRRRTSRSDLTEAERSAFLEIAARLRREADDAPHPGAPAGSAPEPGGERGTAGPSAGNGGVDALRLLDQLPVALLLRTGDGEIHANSEFLRLTGYASSGEFVEAGGMEALFGDPSRPRRDEEMRSKLVLHARDGRELPCEARLTTMDWPGGKALLLAIRVAEPGAEEQRLRERVAELNAILDTATDGVILIRPDGSIRSVNHSAEALFGQSMDQLAGRPFMSLFAVESQRLVGDYLEGLSGNGVASLLNDGREVIGCEAQGGFIPLFMTIGRLPGSGGFCAVLRDITPWKRAEEELIQAKSAAEQASTQKTGFLARISHEIRTPLNAIIGFSELMLDERFGPIGNERYRDYLRDINRSGNHVLELVNDLLDISKIEAGEQEMKFEAVSLNDCLADAVAMMQPEANRERVIIRSSLASGLPDVVADRRSIRQIALNLLSNAIRFTPPGGQVIVSTALEPGGGVVMRVRDTGVGMSQAEIEHALKPFKQVTRMHKRRASGTGLGLPLTKAMAEANRAHFSIDSAPEEGTIVEIRFPPTRVLAA